MDVTRLQERSVLQWHTEGEKPPVERIIWADQSTALVATIDVFDPHAMPRVRPREDIVAALDDGDAHVIKDPYAALIPTKTHITAVAAKERDRALTDIEPLIEATKEGLMFDPKERGKLLREAQHRATPEPPRRSLVTLRKYWRRWLQRGMKGDALLPDFHARGAPGKVRGTGSRKRGTPCSYGGVNITPETRTLLVKGLTEFWENDKTPPFTRAYRQTIGKYFHDGYELKNGVWAPIIPDRDRRPSIKQARYWYAKDGDPERAYRRRHGNRRYELRVRPLDGDTARRLAIGPGSLAEADSTPGDVDLVMRLFRHRVVGRPTIYTLIDVFSRRIIAIYVTLDAPSYVCVLMLMEIAARDKVAFCHEYGVVDGAEEWADCVGLPERTLADRGELEGYNADNLPDNLGVGLGNTAPGRADNKPVVERDHRSTKDDLVRWLHGAKRKDRERGDYDPARDACLTLHEFTGLAIQRALHHNRAARVSDEHLLSIGAIDADVEPYPNDLWTWGMTHRNGGLKAQDVDVVRLHLLPIGTARVTESGIRFSANGKKKLLYTGDTPAKEGWAGKARLGSEWDIEVSFHPDRTDVIYMRLDKGRRLEPLFLKDAYRRFAGSSWCEMEQYWKERSEKEGARETHKMQSAAWLDADIEAANKSARQAKKATGIRLSAYAVRKGWRQNRREAQEDGRPARAWLPIDRDPAYRDLAPQGRVAPPSNISTVAHDDTGRPSSARPAAPITTTKATLKKQAAPSYVHVVRDTGLYDSLLDDSE